MTKVPRRQLVQATPAKLRELILSREPGAQIGSLNEVAQLLDVGIVTVQQAARILEHEGLLAVRRGPGGGYYGTRSDEAALERSIAAYLRVHGFGHRESQQMLSLLDCEIVPAAACCTDSALREKVRELLGRVDQCDSSEARVAFEKELRDLLLEMVAKPLIELLCRVTHRLYVHSGAPLVFTDKEGVEAWKGGRRRILQAILEQRRGARPIRGGTLSAAGAVATSQKGRFRMKARNRAEVDDSILGTQDPAAVKPTAAIRASPR